ncbi:MAG TPA: GAF domain-containing protein [Anaerolineales bacterium]|nr:GAF domain-containing protein [Anaerolineales bacterium]
MPAKTRLSPPSTLRRGETDTIWASTLRAAAGVASRAAASEEDVLHAVTEELRRLKLRGSVMLFTPDGKLEVRTSAISQSLETTLARLTRLSIVGYRFEPSQVDLIRESLRTGQPGFAPFSTDLIRQLLPPSLRGLMPRLMRMLGDNPILTAPLTLGDRKLGMLTLTAPWLTAADGPMLAALADHIAIALSHVRSRAEMRAALEREHLLNQVAEAVASALDLPEVLQRVARLAAELTGSDFSAISLLEPGGDRLGPPYLYGLPNDPRFTPGPRGRGLVWRVIEKAGPVVLDEYAADPHALPAWVEAGVQAFLGIPLVAGDQVIGAMGLFTRHRGKAFGKEQLAIAEGIARMAAIAVSNARLYSEASRRAEEAQALIRTARSITASLDLVTVLSMIAEQARDLLHADGSRIHLLDPERGVLRCLVALDTHAEALLSLELPRGSGLVGWVMEHGAPLLSNEPTSDPRSLHVPGTPQDEPECIIMAPLTVRQRTMGVMVVMREGRARPFHNSDLDLLTALAAQAAVAIENAHLFGQIQAQAAHLEAQVAERTRDLALSEARYRSLVETSIAAIAQVDFNGRVIYANQAFASLMGTTTDMLLGKPMSALMPPDMVDRHRTILEKRLHGEAPPADVIEAEFVSPSGRRVPVLMGVRVIHDEEGQAQGVTILVLDISDRRDLEAALRGERDRLDAILFNVGDAVVVTDADGIIEYVNPAWERLNGYSADEAVGQPASILKSGQHTPDVYADLWRTVKSGKTWHGDLINRRKDGTTYDVALTVTPLLDEAGNVANIVAVLYDISALKQVDRLKTQFVSDVSHELRTPLTNIRLYLDLLRTTSDRMKVERYLDTLSRESDRLAYLIDDLLSLSRLDSGTTTFDVRPVDLNRLLRSLVDDRHALASNRGLNLRLEADANLPLALGDERLLTQVFTNLLTNAINYTPDHGRITIRTYIEDLVEAPGVATDVEDTGPGIPPEERAHLFERFFRGRAGRATGAAGTGLGLAICKEIVDRHGGRISLESGTGGIGARFTVWLPTRPLAEVEKAAG